MEKQAIKTIGTLQKTPWQRFARLQRTAAQLARGRGQPKAVFKFASHEACTAWTANRTRNGKEPAFRPTRIWFRSRGN